MKKLAVTLSLLSMTISGAAYAQSAPLVSVPFPDGDECIFRPYYNGHTPAPVTCESGLSFDVFTDEPLFGSVEITGKVNFIPFLISADPLPVRMTAYEDGDLICESGTERRTSVVQFVSQKITARIFMPAGALPGGQYTYNFQLADSPDGVTPTLETTSDCSFVINVRDRNNNDLDNDGIPNDEDLCADTPSEAVVNQDGCSISQECSCDDLWCSADSYVRCVRSVSLEMVLCGSMSWSERTQSVIEAAHSGCGADSTATWLDALTGCCNSGYNWGW